ncbi:hypothetical protein CI109_106165 [Kwoniella shandongensis]|uniref:Uncharacterized protein n=1 Tax=Kwoniella shandongensis TaxID=1734106 RepID=A0A5M6C1G2_9TREE|nr:uncharacterized protein CI109_003773 [Kwoniella shandongensis]KAA5527802.1 hypothetical protein CI109_003773 [Kwoniella shandongensis]
MPSTFLPPTSTASPNFIASMHPYGKLPSNGSSNNPNPPPPGSNGNAATSPTVPISQPGNGNPAIRNGGTPSTTPGSAGGGITGNGLRPSYGPVIDRSRDRERERQRELANKSYSPYSNASSMLPRPMDAASTTSSSSSSHGHPQQHSLPHHHHHHHHHTHTPQASSQPQQAPEASKNPYSSNPNPRQMNLGRLSGGYGLFGGGSFREQELREKERQERLQRERERERELSKPVADKSPTQRTANIANPANPYPRPSLPPSPTASRNLPAPTSAGSTSKPSISPQMGPASATAAPSGTPRPNLPLPNFSTLGSRSLPSPFERERSGSVSVAASPAVTPATEQPPNIVGHRRTPSGSSARGPESVTGGGQKSPGSTTSLLANSNNRSLYNAPPPLAQVNRDVQRSPVARAPTAASPREREGVVSPSAAAPPKPPTTANNAPTTASTQPPQPNRDPYPPYPTFGGQRVYTTPFTGFNLGGFGGYGAFGPRWDRDRERERERGEEERKRREKEIADQREQREARARAEKEREERDAKWLKARERERAGTAYNVEAFQPPRQGSTTATTQQPVPAADPYRARQNPAAVPFGQKPNYSRHIEVLNHPESQGYAGAPPPTADPVPVSVIQQVAPQREPRPYGYKAEPAKYQYTPRDKRPRLDVAVEEAQTHRRASGTSKSKRRKEEEKKSPVVAAPKERDWAALTVPVKKWPEVNSQPVENWLRKNVYAAQKVMSRVVYTGPGWTLAKSGASHPDNEGGLVIVRIGAGFLGKGWKIRGETGWDEASPLPNEEAVCGAIDKHRQIWGTDVYTDDSDLGQVLVHAGWIKWLDRGDVKEDKSTDQFIHVGVRIVPRLVNYTATERNGVRSRGWGNGHDGASIVVEHVLKYDVTNRYLKSRKRKARMADWERERQLVAPPLPLQDETRKINGVEEQSLTFFTDVSSKKGVIAGFKYAPEALEDWLEIPEEGDSIARSLWSHQLVLEDSDRTYVLWLNPNSTSYDPRINLVENPSSPSAAQTTLLDNAPIDQAVHLLPEGIAIKKLSDNVGDSLDDVPVEENEKGWLLQVDNFRWGKKVEGDWQDEEGWEWLKESTGKVNGGMDVDPVEVTTTI